MVPQKRNFRSAAMTAAALAGAAIISPAYADVTLEAPRVTNEITVDGFAGDWQGIPGITVPLSGDGGVDSVELRAVVRGDMVYVLAVWEDPSQNILHKPYHWDKASKSYKKSKELEDRFAISLRMYGDFSPNKVDGSVFEADVWHWKAARTNPAGVAHDKMWKVSNKAFPKSKEYKTRYGRVYMHRSSDKGKRLYKPVKYDVKHSEVMPGYKVTARPRGSIADVRAKGVWNNGRWYLEFARRLDTGHADDAVIPANGRIEIAVAAFNSVDGKNHSTSEMILLRTDAPQVSKRQD